MLAIGNKERIDEVLGSELITHHLIHDTVSTDYGEELEAVYLPPFFRSEIGAANRLRDLAMMPSPIMDELRISDWEEFLSDLAADNNVELTDQQQGAVRAALANKVSVLTGGPGTGKTTTLRMVIHALEALDFSSRWRPQPGAPPSAWAKRPNAPPARSTA